MCSRHDDGIDDLEAAVPVQSGPMRLSNLVDVNALARKRADLIEMKRSLFGGRGVVCSLVSHGSPDDRVDATKHFDRYWLRDVLSDAYGKLVAETEDQLRALGVEVS